MFRFIIIFFIINFYSPVFSSVKDQIISKIKKIDNLSFNFIQTIGKKKEEGNCIIKYSKKIYCEYNNANKKIIVSNGKSLVIKNRNSGTYYIYPLKKTPLDLLLDKKFLISKITTLIPREIDKKYINFEIFENNNKINIFYNKDTFDLVGWQTEDIYQNLSVTFITSVKINQKIENNFFVLPKKD
jgi:outer membrane lipoprotein-sorting protein